MELYKNKIINLFTYIRRPHTFAFSFEVILEILGKTDHIADCWQLIRLEL